MKKLIGITCLAGFLTIASVYADEVSFHAVNPVMQALVDAVVAADDTVDFAYPHFDEAYCDLKAEKIKYDLQGSIKNTPWLDGGKADVIGTSSYSVDHSAGHSGVNVTMGASVRTDVMAMIRYSAYLALKKANISDTEYGAKFLAHLKRLAVATSLEQVYELLQSAQVLSKEEIQTTIAKDETYLHCLESGKCEVYGDRSEQIVAQKAWIADLVATLPYYDLTRVTPVRESGHIRKINLNSPQVDGFSPPGIRAESDYVFLAGNASLSVSDTSVTSDLSVFYRVKPEDLSDLKSTFEKRLKGLQNGDAVEKENTQGLMRRALISFKRAIRGES